MITVAEAKKNQEALAKKKSAEVRAQLTPFESIIDSNLGQGTYSMTFDSDENSGRTLTDPSMLPLDALREVYGEGGWNVKDETRRGSANGNDGPIISITLTFTPRGIEKSVRPRNDF